MIYGNGKYTYKLVEGWAKLPEKMSFKDVLCVRLDSQDKAYLFTRGTHPVMIFDRNGNYLKAWGDGLFTNLHGGCLGPDNSIYCVDAGDHTASKFTRDGKLIFTMGEKGKPSNTGFEFTPGPGASLDTAMDTITQSGPPFNNPTNAFIAKSGDTYIADGYGNARIHVFSPDGKLKFSWGEPGRGPGQFRAPHGIWIDKHERVWVVDRQNNRIQIFTIQGKFMDQWTDFITPCDIFIDNNETVYIAELGRRISILDKNGKLLARISDREQDKEKALFVAPHGLAVDSHGDIYVGEVASAFQVDRGNRTVQKFARV